MVLVSDLNNYYTTSHVLHRPLNGSALVSSSHLSSYRESHEFLGPSCLCPLLQPVHPDEEPVFKEVAIHKPVFRCYAGQYVAECAESRCGYIGQSSCCSIYRYSCCPSVSFDQMYAKKNVPAKIFSVRGQFSSISMNNYIQYMQVLQLRFVRHPSIIT